MFERIASFENLLSAYEKAKKCKRFRPYVLDFEFGLEKNLTNLHSDLLDSSYRPGPYRQFVVRDSKKRLIQAPDFRDRIIHHALYNLIEPIFDRSFIYDNYACRKEKGVHRAVKRLEYFLKSLNTKLRERERERERESTIGAPRIYYLKCDVSKYFDSVIHQILFGLIAKKIKCPKTLWLIRTVIESVDSGLPIGNLTSQLFANIYLNELDQFVKHHLRLRYYIRYMDDFLILDLDKKKLHEIKARIQEFLRDELNLELHPKKANIFPTDKGVDFLGYVIHPHCKLLRKSTVKRFIRRLKYYKKQLAKGKMSRESFDCSVQSWLGYACFADSRRLRRKILPIYHFSYKPRFG